MWAKDEKAPAFESATSKVELGKVIAAWSPNPPDTLSLTINQRPLPFAQMLETARLNAK